MRIDFKTAIIKYLYQKEHNIENEYITKMSHFRYHNVDEVDFLELIISKARRDLMNEISKDINNLLVFKEIK